MRTFGLIGYPLSHSFSKRYFADKFQREGIEDSKYELFPIEDIQQLPNLIAKESDLCGLNVTIPYKLDVLPFLNELDEAASYIGAVNCISILNGANGLYLKGYNTDAYGFEASFQPLLKAHHRKALVLGDGGAAKAVKYVLYKLQIPFLIVTRKPSEHTILYSDLKADMLEEYTLVINTTPLGMSPNTDTFPELPYEFFTADHLAYDLVYNPEETLFLKKAKEQGAAVKNGLDMLYLQAERSWDIWNG